MVKRQTARGADGGRSQFVTLGVWGSIREQPVLKPTEDNGQVQPVCSELLDTSSGNDSQALPGGNSRVWGSRGGNLHPQEKN